MPLSLGGVGCEARSGLAFQHSGRVVRCLPVIQVRNPDVAAALVNELEGFPSTHWERPHHLQGSL